MQKSITFDGREIRLRLGELAPQAGGSALVSCQDTTVLVTATRGTAREGVDFLPLMVEYEERLYAAGRIPGGFLRREGRPPEKVILTSRLIDRPLRPLIPDWLREDIQVVATTLSLDEEVPPDILAILGTSLAVATAGIPFMGPMAAVRVGLLGDEFIINPTYAEIEAGDLDLVVAGSPQGVVMVECRANQLPEQDMIEAIDFGHEAIQELIRAQQELLADMGITLTVPPAPEPPADLVAWVEATAAADIQAVLDQTIADKQLRNQALEEIKAKVTTALDTLPEEDPRRSAAANDPKLVDVLFKALTKKLMRRHVLEKGIRVDGRKVDEVRPIYCEVGILPRRVHGSALFQRGSTQILSAVTLGTPGDAQELADDLHPEEEKRYLHHYNFPPYSVGEARPLRAPSRREIGHGALAERALVPVLPSKEEFPYVLRVVSEVLSSNGSTSMGSVCGSTLALMDAGVPIKRPVSGVAMGLIKEGDQVQVLTDIQDIEDFLGDMDFKVAGTDTGITALQMDMKITGLDVATLGRAIHQARAGRLFILEKMLAALSAPRASLSPYAPRLLTLKIDPELIGVVIGPGGKTIRGITEETGAKVDIEEDGTVTISATDEERAQKAYRIIDGMTRKLNEGDVYAGRVTRIIPIGAFVEILPGKEGMIHISQLAEHRVGKVEDVVSVGDEVIVRVREIDSRGRINLTRLGIHPDEAATARQRNRLV